MRNIDQFFSLRGRSALVTGGSRGISPNGSGFECEME